MEDDTSEPSSPPPLLLPFEHVSSDSDEETKKDPPDLTVQHYGETAFHLLWNCMI